MFRILMVITCTFWIAVVIGGIGHVRECSTEPWGWKLVMLMTSFVVQIGFFSFMAGRESKEL